MRVLRTMVVPRKYRQTMFSTLHVSPMGGHTGLAKTHWKIAARYYWPNMARDVRAMTLGCAHCRISNATSHEAQQQLQTILSDSPFDAVSMDVWHPGNCGNDGVQAYLLAALDVMTSFALGAFLLNVDLTQVTIAAFTQCFSFTGLPRIIIINSGYEFAGVLIEMCKTMELNHYAVTRGNHKAILAERLTDT